MRSLKSFALLAALVSVAAIGCDCGGGTPSDPDAGRVDAGDGGPGDGGDGGEPDAGEPDAGQPDPLPTDIKNPNNDKIDTDCDGLSDQEEFSLRYAGDTKTHPGLADTDWDGLKDGLEVGRTTSVDPTCTTLAADADPATRTSPVLQDSDADGVPDGREDANHNGRFDDGETDPNDADTDHDGLTDGTEDANHNGTVDANESNPRLRDTDGDGAGDGVEVNFMNTNPRLADTDGDGCRDPEEDVNQNGTLETGETNPNLATDCGGTSRPDSDQDGIPDDVEAANGLDPNSADSDGDGLDDGLEDSNRDGLVQAGETNPRRVDSDCDGLRDGPTMNGQLGEDLDADGVKDANETDPRKLDTDGDGLADGLERGVTASIDAANCPNTPVDTHPTSTTDPTKNDTDGDGIEDGAEDADQDGNKDPGELDPNNQGDGSGPAGAVCTTANLQPVRFESESQADLSLGLPVSFTEVTPIVQGGTPRGMMGYDSARKVAFLVYRKEAPAGAATVTAIESALRGTIDNPGALSNITSQTFDTWDGYPALQAFYDQAGTSDLKGRANALANELLGAGAGVLSGNAGSNGPFKLQAEFIRRSNQSVVVLIALTPLSLYDGNALFSMKDVAGGSAVAQFGDTTAVQCEPFTPQTAKVDFLFSIDDSGSMDNKQTALRQAADDMAARLGNSSLDYRLAVVTSSYLLQSGQNSGKIRGWVTATGLNDFKAWLTVPGTCTNFGSQCDASSGACRSQLPNGYIGVCGSGNEGVVGSARKAIDDMSKSSTPAAQKIRTDASVVTILLGDADDQTTGYTSTDKCADGTPQCENINNFLNYFQNTGSPPNPNPLGRPITVHGIICPEGQACGEADSHSTPRRNPQLLTATGGVRASVIDINSIGNAINDIVEDAIARTAYKLQKPPIGASLKVAMTNVLTPASCPNAATDMPRSRVNGWDFDGKSGTVAFFGACRPTTTSQAAVSYRYWINNTQLPDGSPPPCFNDPYYDENDADFCSGNRVCDPNYNQCTCPSGCGGNPPSEGMVCNSALAVCDFICPPDCGGACGANQTCNTGTCGCTCEQTQTCPAGQTFVNDGVTCGCSCDVTQLECGGNYEADAAACACVCKDDCGGCGPGSTCNPSSCTCSIRID